jgi:hypothetical protein
VTKPKPPPPHAVGSLLERGVRRLPADVARCPGYEPDPGDLREGCEDCRRRTDRSKFPLQAWMEPPPIVVFECEARIEP